MKKLNLLSALIIGCAVSTPVMANDLGSISFLKKVKITKMITTGGELYGGCMMQVDKVIASVSPNCRSSWVTFSCDGKLGNSKSQAAAMWNTAQMAFVLEKVVQVRVRSATINDYCYADLIELD